MNIYFWQRGMQSQSIEAKVPRDLNLKLERYSKVWFGGCDDAELSIEGGKESLLLLLNLVRCGISIYTKAAVPLWWGYVSRVEVEIDGIVATVDFENMANDLAVAYTLVDLNGSTVGTRQTTAWLKDADSIAEYGDRQLLESGASMNAVAADALANQKLASLKLPKLVVTTRSSEGKNQARVFCKGWYHLLEGRYCLMPTTSVLVETTQQIQNYLSQYGEVFTSVRIDVLSGVYTESYRNGDTTVYSELQAHQENGTSNYRRILSRVNVDRSVDVWEQPEEPWQPDIEYRTDGKIYYLAGSEIEPGYDPVGKWISVIPITKSSSYFSAINGMNNYFIDACEWNADGRPSIRPSDWKNPYAVRIQNG
jgi:hypothetical protein